MQDHEDEAIEEQIQALDAGRAFVRPANLRIVNVAGADAVGWLQDLLTADVASLAPGRTCRSFLLTPTGHVRADVQLLRGTDAVTITQAPDAGDAIDEALARYVVTSDVTLERIDGHTELIGVPEGPPGSDAFTPSTLAARADVLVPRGELARRLVSGLIGLGMVEASAVALERRRVRHGDPRMGPDFDGSSLPAEVGLEEAIAFDKGCFLGQESVARVRNLGHPPTVLRHLRSPVRLGAGDPLSSAGEVIGMVTSAAPAEDGWVALVRVAWAARNAGPVSADGHLLQPVLGPG